MKISRSIISRLVLITILTIAFLYTLPAAKAQEQGAAAEPHVKIRLVPERSVIRPNETIWIAIEQVIDEGWHTYWVNAGDSGDPTRTEWNLPENFRISDIEWPIPHKISMAPLTNYGYEDKVILLQSLTAPNDIPDGPIELAVDVELLVCEEICIPEYSTHTLTLNRDGLAADNTAYIDDAMQALPFAVPLWETTFTEKNGNLVVNIRPDGKGFFKSIDTEKPFYFFPYDWGLVKNPAAANVTIEDQSITLTQARGDRPLGAIDNLHGLIAYTDVTGRYSAFSFHAHPTAALSDKRIAAKAEQDAAQIAREAGHSTESLYIALLFAFIGGIILNLMPCVFPVLSIKALSLCRMNDKELKHARMHGLLYTAGILVTFGAIAGALIALKAGGAQIGWGFQLQNPTIILFLSWLLFLIGLNLAGYFNLSVMLSDGPHKKDKEETATGSFFTGVLATLVATPCTAPFMGVAIGFAMVQPAIVGMLVFLTLGLGLALPYLLLCFFPALRGMLPKPGVWMARFKEFLAFPMFLSAVWLTWVYATQAGDLGIFKALGGMVLITFGIWLMKATPEDKSAKKWIRDILGFITLVAILFLLVNDMKARQAMKQLEKAGINLSESQFEEAFTAQRYDDLIQSGQPVFVNMTADWCITCKVNETVALNIPSTKILFKNRNIRYLKGDWTNEDPEITAYLDKYGRNGVPLYVYYAPVNPETGQRPAPQVLPQILTPGILKNAITN